jgi:hypothetical protein
MSAMPPGQYSPPWYADRGRWRLVTGEIIGTTAVLVVYFLLRGVRPDATEDSVARSLHLIRFEQRVGIFQEVSWQSAFIDHHWLMNFANWIYAWGHYPVLLAIALWLVVKDPLRFRFVRNVMLLSAIVGVLTYWILPAAPPRLMAAHGYDYGFIDTVHGAASNAHYFQPGPFVNDYAALPSFHFGWILLATLAIWVNTERRSVRMAAVGMSIVMFWAITVTGNHYFFDMIFGGIVVVLCWMAVDGISRTTFPAAVRRKAARTFAAAARRSRVDG